VDLLTGTGLAEGKEVPYRVPLSEDSYTLGLMLTESRDKMTREWKEWASGTNFPGEENVFK
jgi:hypothetical protein